MQSKHLLYQIALTLIPNIGDVLAKNLVSYLGDPEKVFKARKFDLKKVPGIDEVRAKSILHFNDFNTAEKEILFIEKNKINPLFYLDDGYPSRLKGLTDSPILLYTKGNMNLNSERMIAIVGTRHASDYGKNMCESLISGLKNYNATIVSGLAYGIDIAAHKIALQFDLPTIGVLGHGLNQIYPNQHRATAIKMLEAGGLVTEFKSIDSFEPENFPKRNRIVAGLCDATIVVESAVKGGALITAEIASSYNRDVFVVPGRVGDKYSEGCNYFIKTNKANLVECAEDIAFFLGWVDKKKSHSPKQKQIFIELDENERKLLSLLDGNNSLHVDALSQQSGLFGSQLAVGLLNLEFKGMVISLPGKMYRLA
ncbi:MAG: DNA-protecting protein DprA [Chitinophagales bacterium]|nr:DNA-protecting protein DprA [Chitinophagales bacterium]